MTHSYDGVAETEAKAVPKAEAKAEAGVVAQAEAEVVAKRQLQTNTLKCWQNGKKRVNFAAAYFTLQCSLQRKKAADIPSLPIMSLFFIYSPLCSVGRCLC
jgi:hypothetical protein